MQDALIYNSDDTICAISTAPGTGGIAVARVSGHNAITIVSKIWKGKNLNDVASHSAHLGIVYDSNGEILDELLTKWEGMGYRFELLPELKATGKKTN